MSPALFQLAALGSEKEILSLYHSLSTPYPAPGLARGLAVVGPCAACKCWCRFKQPRCPQCQHQGTHRIPSPASRLQERAEEMVSPEMPRAQAATQPARGTQPSRGVQLQPPNPHTMHPSSPCPLSGGDRAGSCHGQVGSGHKHHFHHTCLHAADMGTGSGFAAIITFAAKDRQHVAARSGVGEPLMVRSRRM